MKRHFRTFTKEALLEKTANNWTDEYAEHKVVHISLMSYLL